ncbi:MAG: glycosyl transferase family 4 [Candidatus Altiarchaeales archaeon]|nr:glycosyl transferase family 4 [Candidatus Altiarchaeales archaeon]MBD3415626.1 glycosyl transferase family 4 [Candidatus Altiarchaeales archaeon]
MWGLLTVLAASFAATYMMVPWLIPRLLKAGIKGRDMNKEGDVVVPEMGGFAIIGGFVVGVLLAIALTTFNLVDVGMDLSLVLASLSTILIMALIGVIDDLFLMTQKVKALLPVFAALPLVAVKAGVTSMEFPLVGVVDFGILYPLLLVPIAITGAANATNMLAGFNGLEAGLGAIMCLTVGSIGWYFGRVEAVVLSLAMLGALFAFLSYNWYPAKILIGDIGTLSIGAVVASSVIVGNLESVGIILMMPFFAELFLKARSGFQADSWCEVKDGKLFCEKKSERYGWGRLLMYYYGGASEVKIVFTILIVEILIALIAFSYIFLDLFGVRVLGM